MKKIGMGLAFSALWLLGAVMWGGVAVGPDAGSMIGNVFQVGSIILYILAGSTFYNTLKLFKSWVEWKAMGF